MVWTLLCPSLPSPHPMWDPQEGLTGHLQPLQGSLHFPKATSNSSQQCLGLHVHPTTPGSKQAHAPHTSAHREPELRPRRSRIQMVVTRAPRQTPRSLAPRRSLQQGSLSAHGDWTQSSRLTTVLRGLPLPPCLTNTWPQTRHPCWVPGVQVPTTVLTLPVLPGNRPLRVCTKGPALGQWGQAGL